VRDSDVWPTPQPQTLHKQTLNEAILSRFAESLLPSHLATHDVEVAADSTIRKIHPTECRLATRDVPEHRSL